MTWRQVVKLALNGYIQIYVSWCVCPDAQARPRILLVPCCPDNRPCVGHHSCPGYRMILGRGDESFSVASLSIAALTNCDCPLRLFQIRWIQSETKSLPIVPVTNRVTNTNKSNKTINPLCYTHWLALLYYLVNANWLVLHIWSYGPCWERCARAIHHSFLQDNCHQTIQASFIDTHPGMPIMLQL